MPVTREDPYGQFNFLVKIPGVTDDGTEVAAGFSEVSGLGVSIDPIEYRNGNEKENTVRKLPGLKKFPNITLKRGVIGDLGLWEWILQAMNGTVQRADGEISLLDENREPVMVWKFVRGWPCRYEGPSLKGKKNEVAIEAIEICHEGLSIQ